MFVVEEPVECAPGSAPFLRSELSEGVTILTPHLPSGPSFQPGFNERANPEIRILLSEYFGNGRLSERCALWYYTPMAVGAEPANLLPTATIVYDAMDELSNFLGAPSDLAARELHLIDRADVVFTGGPSLYEKRRHLNRRTYCFPSGVDRSHFRRPASAVPADIERIRKPVIGFFGVLDERIDFELMAAIADQRPDWSIVLVGPFAKVREEDAPRRANIHYLGRKTYAELPAYLEQFDVAILPFALNEATRFISPTKTLEYLAGGKPVVSTPVKDVVDLYGTVVSIADNADRFVVAIDEQLMRAGDTSRLTDQRRLVDQLLREHSWDEIAHKMQLAITACETSTVVSRSAPLPYNPAHVAPDRTDRHTVELTVS